MKSSHTKNKKKSLYISLVIFVLVLLIAIAVSGILIYRHHQSESNSLSFKAGTHKYSGYDFPDVPKAFKLMVRQPAVTTRQESYFPSIVYSSKASLKQIENVSINICKDDNYILNGGFYTAHETLNSNGPLVEVYSLQCELNFSTWQFEIARDVNPSVWDIYLNQEPPALCQSTISTLGSNSGCGGTYEP
jgi:hypothetical protein